MKARKVVNKMLESDEGISDPMEYALSTPHPPSNLLSDTLRDELVEKGWRHIRLRQEDDDEWVVEAGVIDPHHRTSWLENGARVAPSPTETPDLRMKLMRMFKAAALRASVNVADAKIEDLSPAYDDGYDLYTKYDDFEDDSGDWNVAIRFKWKPGDKFWSKASQSLGYETKPYQRQPPAPRPPIKPVAGAAGKEPERIARRLKKGAAAAPEDDLERQKEWVKRTTGPT
jgi:hypothetical protein